jgi:hypothetical protein
MTLKYAATFAMLTAVLVSINTATPVAAKGKDAAPKKDSTPKEDSAPKKKEPGSAKPKRIPLQPINVDREVARIKKQMSEIKALPISAEQKIQKQRSLLDGELAHARTQMQQLKADESKDAMDASRDRYKAGLDTLGKLLDIIRSMNPQI